MEQNKMNILNRFFSRNTFRHCIEDGYDKTYGQVIKRYVQNGANRANYELISEVYSVLRHQYRNEYYYKNTLLNKLLLGVHSVNTTVALTEVPIAKSKADFLMINGKAVVYEIKTELDNFDRLESQINDYYRAFDHVAVVTCKEYLSMLQKKLMNIEKPVGIYVLQKRGTLTEIRKPDSYKQNLESEIMFKILRKHEFEEIVLRHYGNLPIVSEFQYYSVCKKLFVALPVEEVYEEVLQILKCRSKIVKEEFDKVPYELKFLAYFMNLSNNDYKKLTVFLNQVHGGV